jgi:hypothetical protein
MPRPYGFILDSAVSGVTRVVRHGDRVTIERLAVAHEITLTTVDFQALGALLAAGPEQEADPVRQRLAELPPLGGTVLEHVGELLGDVPTFQRATWRNLLQRERIDPDAPWEEVWDLVEKTWPSFARMRPGADGQRICPPTERPLVPGWLALADLEGT